MFPAAKRFTAGLTALVILLSFFLLIRSAAANEKKPLTVFVSIMPEKYFVQRIGGDRVDVHALVEPGQNPATYAPSPQQMVRLATARLYFTIGVPFENALAPKIKESMPGLAMVDLQEGIELMHLEEGHEHTHGGSNLDPHSWLDPNLVKQMAATIKDTLSRQDPAGSAYYEKNYETFSEELTLLDRKIRKILQPFTGRSIYAFHPAYGYFCKAYGLLQKAVSVDGKEPGARHIAGLIEKARHDEVKAIFIQPEFSVKTAEAIAAEIGAKVLALDPLAYNYLDNMEHMAYKIRQAFPPRQQ